MADQPPALPPSPSLDDLAALACAAGRIVYQHFQAGCPAEAKSDGSPVTVADREAEALILAGLARLAPTIPVVAEEDVAAGFAPECADTFFLVDPLDGTREFVESRSGEFTVNIGLIAAKRPLLGVIYAPVRGALYAGGPDGAWKQACLPETAAPAGPRTPIAVTETPARLRALTSRRSTGADAFLARIGAVERTAMSSSLKLCLVAEGAADLYPRFGQVSEWDIAAGEAILAAAGGVVLDRTGEKLHYGDRARGFRVDGFLALGGPVAQAAGRAALPGA